MKLPMPKAVWDRMREIEVLRRLEKADSENFKSGRDVEIGSARLILTASDGSRWSVEVDTLGNLSASSV